MPEWMAQIYAVPHSLVEWALVAIFLLSGVIWTAQVRKVMMLDRKVKCLAVGMLFLIRLKANQVGAKPPPISYEKAETELITCLKM